MSIYSFELSLWERCKTRVCQKRREQTRAVGGGMARPGQAPARLDFAVQQTDFRARKARGVLNEVSK